MSAKAWAWRTSLHAQGFRGTPFVDCWTVTTLRCVARDDHVRPRRLNGNLGVDVLFDALGSLDVVVTGRGQRHGTIGSGALDGRAVECRAEARHRTAPTGSRTPEFVGGARQGGIACVWRRNIVCVNMINGPASLVPYHWRRV